MSQSSKIGLLVTKTPSNIDLSVDSDAKSKVLSLLNRRKPQYPPDVYYIRRKPDVLKLYLNDYDGTHMEELKSN